MLPSLQDAVLHSEGHQPVLPVLVDREDAQPALVLGPDPTAGELPNRPVRPECQVDPAGLWAHPADEAVAGDDLRGL